MEQKSKVYGWGWTLCKKDINAKHTKDWRKVTCKNCLKHKRLSQKQGRTK